MLGFQSVIESININQCKTVYADGSQQDSWVVSLFPHRATPLVCNNVVPFTRSDGEICIRNSTYDYNDALINARLAADIIAWIPSIHFELMPVFSNSKVIYIKDTAYASLPRSDKQMPRLSIHEILRLKIPFRQICPEIEEIEYLYPKFGDDDRGWLLANKIMMALSLDRELSVPCIEPPKSWVTHCIGVRGGKEFIVDVAQDTKCFTFKIREPEFFPIWMEMVYSAN